MEETTELVLMHLFLSFRLTKTNKNYRSTSTIVLSFHHIRYAPCSLFSYFVKEDWADFITGKITFELDGISIFLEIF